MKFFFLNDGLVEALHAFGVKLDGTEALDNLSTILTRDDINIIEMQSQRMEQFTAFKSLSALAFNDYAMEPSAEETRWDVFLSDGALSRPETERRLNMLNCVTTGNGTLVLFEDELNTTPVRENMLVALANRKSNNEVMATPLWKQYLKTL